MVTVSLRQFLNVEHVIGPALIAGKFDVKTDLRKIDAFIIDLDGPDDKSRLGANAILGVSMACARAGAAAKACLTTMCDKQD